MKELVRVAPPQISAAALAFFQADIAAAFEEGAEIRHQRAVQEQMRPARIQIAKAKAVWRLLRRGQVFLFDEIRKTTSRHRRAQSGYDNSQQRVLHQRLVALRQRPHDRLVIPDRPMRAGRRALQAFHVAGIA